MSRQTAEANANTIGNNANIRQQPATTLHVGAGGVSWPSFVSTVWEIGQALYEDRAWNVLGEFHMPCGGDPWVGKIGPARLLEQQSREDASHKHQQPQRKQHVHPRPSRQQQQQPHFSMSRDEKRINNSAPDHIEEGDEDASALDDEDTQQELSGSEHMPHDDDEYSSYDVYEGSTYSHSAASNDTNSALMNKYTTRGTNEPQYQGSHRHFDAVSKTDGHRSTETGHSTFNTTRDALRMGATNSAQMRSTFVDQQRNNLATTTSPIITTHLHSVTTNQRATPYIASSQRMNTDAGDLIAASAVTASSPMGRSRFESSYASKGRAHSMGAGPRSSQEISSRPSYSPGPTGGMATPPVTPPVTTATTGSGGISQPRH